MECGSTLELSGYFGVQRVEEEGGIRFVLRGELDRAAARMFEEVVDEVATWQPSALTLDAAGLTFCDAAGVRAVLNAHNVCARNGIGLRVVGVRPSVQRVFSLTGANQSLVIDAD